MFTIILCMVYVAFIGFGFPNDIFGAAWPAIHEELMVLFIFIFMLRKAR